MTARSQTGRHVWLHLRIAFRNSDGSLDAARSWNPAEGLFS
jgi:hypothetical protein